MIADSSRGSQGLLCHTTVCASVLTLMNERPDLAALQPCHKIRTTKGFICLGSTSDPNVAAHPLSKAVVQLANPFTRQQ